MSFPKFAQDYIDGDRCVLDFVNRVAGDHPWMETDAERIYGSLVVHAMATRAMLEQARRNREGHVYCIMLAVIMTSLGLLGV